MKNRSGTQQKSLSSHKIGTKGVKYIFRGTTLIPGQAGHSLNAGNGALLRLRLLEKPFSAGARRGTSRQVSLNGSQPKAVFSEKRGMTLLSLFIADNSTIKTQFSGKCKGKLYKVAQNQLCNRKVTGSQRSNCQSVISTTTPPVSASAGTSSKIYAVMPYVSGSMVALQSGSAAG